MTITVSQLNNYIHGVFDLDGTLSYVSVSGEVTNLKKWNNSWYFSLKDNESAINCFCYDPIVPETGAIVIAEGQVRYFIRNGSVTLFVKRLTSTSNTGEAYRKFVELKEKLKKEGIFDESRKKIVPHICNRIGVVTSETGAVIHDIKNVILRRQPFSDIFLYPVKVQGAGADLEIAEGINFFNSYDVDVVIVGRGGGSDEDLSVFNSENVVRAVADCVKPIVSAVGHGIDYTLCDFAADMRAVTPTEAGEFVTIDVSIMKERVSSDLFRISDTIENKLQRQIDKIQIIANKISSTVDLDYANIRNSVVNIVSDCERKVDRMLVTASQNIENSMTRLVSLNPSNVLKRGYAYASNDKGIVKSVNDVKIGSQLLLTLSDGLVKADVTEKVSK